MLIKKGQLEGKAVGVLILLIALTMALYVLFIPPEDRQALLNPSNETYITSSSSSGVFELISEIPGAVSPEKQPSTDHNFVPVNLYIKSEPKIFNLADTLAVSKSLFSKSFPILYFNIDKKDLKKVTLFFSVSEADGELRISLNNNDFYSQTTETSVKLIDLPLEFLQEKNNKLELSVSSPGLAFWGKNKYTLNNLGIKEEFELINSREERLFTMPQLERDSLEKAVLSFFQVCNMKLPKNSVPLKVYLNNNPIPILSTRIMCISAPQTIEIENTNFLSGQNKISFLLEEAGDFTLNEIKITTESKKSDYPQYTFSLSKSQYDEIKAGAKKLNLELFLANTKVDKKARISVNSGELFLATKESSFKFDLKDYAEQGSNFVRIVPQNNFVINGLKVTLN